MNKVLPKDLTSYDVLKTLAVVLMIIDHIGMYFYPEALWWRVFGRASAPIWLFLIGYSNSRDLPAKLWIGAVILTFAGLFDMAEFWPLTILVGMMVVRKIIDQSARTIFAGFEPFMFGLVGLSLFMIHSHLVVEYGLLCLVIALYGYLVRRRASEEGGGIALYQRVVFIAFALVSYLAMNVVGTELSAVQSASMIGVVALTFGVLYFFKSQTYQKITAALPKAVVAIIQFGGRRTLEIYVAHILLFKLLAYIWGTKEFVVFDFSQFVF